MLFRFHVNNGLVCNVFIIINIIILTVIVFVQNMQDDKCNYK